MRAAYVAADHPKLKTNGKVHRIECPICHGWMPADPKEAYRHALQHAIELQARCQRMEAQRPVMM